MSIPARTRGTEVEIVNDVYEVFETKVFKVREIPEALGERLILRMGVQIYKEGQRGIQIARALRMAKDIPIETRDGPMILVNEEQKGGPSLWAVLPSDEAMSFIN